MFFCKLSQVKCQPKGQGQHTKTRIAVTLNLPTNGHQSATHRLNGLRSVIPLKKTNISPVEKQPYETLLLSCNAQLAALKMMDPKGLIAQLWVIAAKCMVGPILTAAFKKIRSVHYSKYKCSIILHRLITLNTKYHDISKPC